MGLTGRNFEITGASGGAAFQVRVMTRAPQLEVVGLGSDGALRVRLTAREAGDPEANAELVYLLAWFCGVREDQVEIVGGQSGPNKIVSIEGVTPTDIEARLGGTVEE